MRCPVCKAEVDEGPQCRRCRADLSLLFTLEEQRQQALGAARHWLKRGKTRQALAIAAGVEALKNDAESLRLRALVHLRERDFEQAWQCYQANRRLQSS